MVISSCPHKWIPNRSIWHSWSRKEDILWQTLSKMLSNMRLVSSVQSRGEYMRVVSSPQSTRENMNRGEQPPTLTFTTKSLFSIFVLLGLLGEIPFYIQREPMFGSVERHWMCPKHSHTFIFPQDTVKLACNEIWFHTNTWSSKEHGTWREIAEASGVHVRKPCWLTVLNKRGKYLDAQPLTTFPFSHLTTQNLST